MRSIALFVSLCVFYVLLSGQFHNTTLMVAGVIGSALVTLLARHMGVVDEEGMPVEHWFRTAIYIPWLWWQIVKANIDVAKIVWTPRIEDAIDPEVLDAPHDLKTAYGVSTYANSITLTPGTVTMDIQEGKFIVHAITRGMGDDLREGGPHDMANRSAWVEGQNR